MKNRNEQTASERQKTERSGGNNEVENLRNGMLDGKKRQHSPEDLARASEVR